LTPRKRSSSIVFRISGDEVGRLNMRYSHVNRGGELMTGRCESTPEALLDGRLRLHERWQWTSGDGSRGESIVEEVRGRPDAEEM
jgi:hypothetical protein